MAGVDGSAPLPAEPSREFFALQYRFAAAVSLAAGVPLEAALLSHTSFYLRFRLPRPIDAGDPGWREYLSGLVRSADHLDWTWRYLASRPRPAPRPGGGCFAYHLVEPTVAHLHFENRDRSGESPLASSRLPARLEELRIVIRAIAAEDSRVTTVRGGSWLYNLPAYRSLFPPAYLRTARPVARFQAADLWGQFLDRRGRVRQEVAEAFLACVERQRTLEGLVACFPHRVLALECPIAEFRAFYRL